MLGTQSFPGRDLVLVSTYCVIVVTLVGLGMTLPWVIQRAGLGELGRAEAREDQRAEVIARIDGVDAVLRRIDEMEREGVRIDLVKSLRNRHADRRAHLAATADDAVTGSPTADEAMLQLELVEVERAWNAKSYAEELITDDARRRVERELDLEEARARHAAQSAAHIGADGVVVDGPQLFPAAARVQAGSVDDSVPGKTA
jgi:monovalent cation/hydrogen antiporter